jgi:GNAT superfamily N-acetyltransferase
MDDALWTMHAKVFALGEAERRDEEVMKALVGHGAVLCVAMRDDIPLARCLVGRHAGKDPGLFFAGFFTSSEDGAARCQSYGVLLQAAKEHVRIQSGGQSLVAPVNGHSWFAYRLREDDHPTTFPWEPRRDPALRAALMESGFKQHLPYWSIGSRGLDQVLAHSAPFYHAALKKHFRFVPFTDYSGEKSQSLLRTIWQLTHLAFADAPLFAPIEFDEYCQFSASSYDAVPRDLGRILIAPDGNAIGYMWNFFAADRSTVIFKSMAIDPDYHGQRLADAILYEPVREALARGAKDFVSAMVLRGNKSEFISRHGETLWEHHYGTWIWRA